MRPMTINELYDVLCSKKFQDLEHGVLNYNFYIFQYNPADEYEIRRQIKDFKEKLIRPINFVDILDLNIFDEFCTYLSKKQFGPNPSYLDYIKNKEKSNPDGITKLLCAEALRPDFFKYIHKRIIDHVNIDDEMNRPYVFLYGMGDMFPYLRTNIFMANYEEYNKPNRYKIIIFYPGHKVESNFRLFDSIDDQHNYRATFFINDYLPSE